MRHFAYMKTYVKCKNSIEDTLLPFTIGSCLSSYLNWGISLNILHLNVFDFEQHLSGDVILVSFVGRISLKISLCICVPIVFVYLYFCCICVFHVLCICVFIEFVFYHTWVFVHLLYLCVFCCCCIWGFMYLSICVFQYLCAPFHPFLPWPLIPFVKLTDRAPGTQITLRVSSEILRYTNIYKIWEKGEFMDIWVTFSRSCGEYLPQISPQLALV